MFPLWPYLLVTAPFIVAVISMVFSRPLGARGFAEMQVK